MFSLQWNIENLLAPLVVMLIGEILKWFFVQITEYIKNHIFLLTTAVPARMIIKRVTAVIE